jgi:hypothetical protein
VKEVLHDDAPVELVRIEFSAQGDRTTVLRSLVGASFVPTADFRLSKLVAHKQPLHCC